MRFLDMMNALFAIRDKFPEVEIEPHDGYLTIRVYVGIENTDLFRQAQQMFEPVD